MKKFLPLVSVCLGTLMLLVDVTIVNVALPAMSLDLDATFTQLQWVVDVYAVLLAAALLTLGRLGDRFGHRGVHLAGLGLFGGASLLCGLADGATVLIVARAVQGVGAAALFSTTFPLINAAYQGRDRGVAYGVWGAISGAASSLGPIAGGVLTGSLSWQWIFFVNLPITLVAVVLGLRALPTTAADPCQRIDTIGVATFTAFAAALTYGLIEAGFSGWSEPRVVTALVIAVATLVGFLLCQRSTVQPLLDLRLLRNRVFVATLLAGAVVNLSSFAALGFVSIWLQSVQGLSPIEAGLAGGLPLSLVALVASAVAGRSLNHRDPVLAMAGGLVAVAAGSFVLALQLRGDAGWTHLVAGQVLVGAGVGLAIPVLSSTAMSVVDWSRAGMAAGTVNTARQLGFAVGLAALGSWLTSSMASYLHDQEVSSPGDVSQGIAAGQAQSLFQGLEDGRQMANEVFVYGLSQLYVISGVLAVITAVTVFVLMRPSASRRRQVQCEQETAPAE